MPKVSVHGCLVCNVALRGESDCFEQYPSRIYIISSSNPMALREFKTSDWLCQDAKTRSSVKGIAFLSDEDLHIDYASTANFTVFMGLFPGPQCPEVIYI